MIAITTCMCLMLMGLTWALHGGFGVGIGTGMDENEKTMPGIIGRK